MQMKMKSVLVPELGDGLLWKDCLAAKAAREALGRVDKCPDDFTVVFCVNEEKYKLWDEMMSF